MSFREKRSGAEESFLLSSESKCSFSNNKHSGDTQEISPLRFTAVEKTIAIMKTAAMSLQVERSEESFELRYEMHLSNNKHSGDTQKISPLRFSLVEKTVTILECVYVIPSGTQ